MAESPWRNTILAALASYLDSGSIVAGAAGLALWTQQFHLGKGTIGLIGAISSNAISAGVGALAGGWLADRIGRKPVYQWDLLVYAFGVLWIVAAARPWMLVLGYVLCGLAVGADVPASWTMIAEGAPANRRARHTGAAQLLWIGGPAVVLSMALALSGLGVLGIRIVFAHLLVVSLVLWGLRRRMRESPMWKRAASTTPERAHFSRAHVPALALLAGMYGLWNLKAGTGGFFLPYLLRTVGAQTQAQSVAFQLIIGLLGGLTTVLVFMRWVDRLNRRPIFATAIVFQAGAMALLALFALTTPVVLAYVGLTGLSGGFGPQHFFQLWSAESFPTLLRTTALGVMFAVVRIVLGVWSLFVPRFAAADFATLAWVLTGFVVASGVLGLIFAPAYGGKSLETLR